MRIEHLNPEGLHQNPAFSQAVSVEGPAKMVYIGGQNGVNAEGQLVGESLEAQTEQALMNVLALLNAAGAAQEDVVRLMIYLVKGQDLDTAFEVAQPVWGPHPTAISVLVVEALAVPGALVEIDATAAVGA